MPISSQYWQSVTGKWRRPSAALRHHFGNGAALAAKSRQYICHYWAKVGPFMISHLGISLNKHFVKKNCSHIYWKECCLKNIYKNELDRQFLSYCATFPKREKYFLHRKVTSQEHIHLCIVFGHVVRLGIMFCVSTKPKLLRTLVYHRH